MLLEPGTQKYATKNYGWMDHDRSWLKANKSNKFILFMFIFSSRLEEPLVCLPCINDSRVEKVATVGSIILCSNTRQDLISQAESR